MAKTQMKEKTAPAVEEKRAELRKFIDEMKTKEHRDSHLIDVLHKTQELYGYLPTEVMDEIAQAMEIPTAHIWGVATFYHYFKLTPPGKHEISRLPGHRLLRQGRHPDPAGDQGRAEDRLRRGDGGRAVLAGSGPVPRRLRPGPGRHDRRARSTAS